MSVEIEAIKNKIHALVNEYVELKFVKKDFVPHQQNVPVSGKVFDADDINSIVDASLDGWFTTGRFNIEFEKTLAKYIGCKSVLTVNSGSSANLLAFATLTDPELGDRAIQPGDEVISVAASFPTTINPLLQYGAIPVFVDITIPSYNIDVSQIEQAITSKTKAIIIAHTLGNPFNVEEVNRIAKKHNLWLIEDCCDALGAEFNGKHVGTFGDIATLSFYPAHHITMGEIHTRVTLMYLFEKPLTSILISIVMPALMQFNHELLVEATASHATKNTFFYW